jgi:hypothetical protein
MKVAIAGDDPVFGKIKEKTHHGVNGSIQSFRVPMVLATKATGANGFNVGWMFDDTKF